ncbi:MAG: hotdog fold thioesterase [Magnetococcales bacterium]|nr:hotdog fold thioesterase [Magnetococcales bacterium]
MTDSPPPEPNDPLHDENGLRVGQWMQASGFHRLLGIQVEAARSGWCRASLVVTADLLNPFGITHGGVVFTLAEFAYGVAGNASGETAVGLMTSMTFPASSREGDRLTAEAREMATGSRTRHFQVEVRRTDGQVIGLFTGVLFRRGDPLSQWMTDAKPMPMPDIAPIATESGQPALGPESEPPSVEATRPPL